jgi:hypothetical protein
MTRTLPIGATIIVPWQGTEMLARVAALRGSYPRVEVIAQLSPVSSELAPTVAVPFRDVRWVRAPVRTNGVAAGR